ncbi:MAG: hypothetical protein LUH56_01935 [Oscillospiraceae bacterium]|nr:hypothetical protein [Oscillospiraceae bacterium]
MTTKEDLEKLEAELAEILKNIEEIDKIISEYDEKGTLNRDRVINKIADVRRKNQAVQAITVTTLSYSNVSLSNASNEVLVSELRMQRDVLQADYLKKKDDEVALRGKIRLGI